MPDDKMVCENTIDGRLLYRMLQNGFASLIHNKKYLNDVNIFPVSDNDTGTNMKNTFERGVDSLKDEASFYNVITGFVKGMLIGSRGNSGFILSQYFWGISEYAKDKETVTIADLCNALQHAYRFAYRAVVKPTDGTMLTVMRDGIGRTMPDISEKISTREFFDVLVEKMFISTQETVKQMDILRENNVVDSGALGLYLIFDGMRRTLHDDPQYFDCRQSGLLPERSPDLVKNVSFFRFCTEFILKMHDIKDDAYFVHLLENRGDSILVATDEDMLKVHIHTNKPQDVMNEFTKYGSIVSNNVDDLFITEEFEKLKRRKYKDFAVVAFTNGEGNATTLEQFGADVAFTVPVGYSLDEDELKMLIDGFLGENLIIFPNNKDIQTKFKRIKWFSDLQNLYVVKSDCLAKTFFTISSMIFADEFYNVSKSLERLNKQRVFQTSIVTSTTGNCIRYSAYHKNKSITDEDLAELLNAVADEEVLKPYSTVVVFGGKYCRPKDVESIYSHFEKNSNVEFTYFENQHSDYDFIIGAY
ncbi:MAG: DAK2 domain-containing protein [Tannerella sp.]|jgi:DAK2 domain fusion protein YloV|nr:DAK2 domain-containing protein [Tannerella sp.]